MSRRASRCSTRRTRSRLLEDHPLDVLLAGGGEPRQRRRPRARDRSITLASDFAFQRRVRRSDPGPRRGDRMDRTRRRRRRRDRGTVAERSASTPDDTIESVEARILHASLISPAEWPRADRDPGQGPKTDRDQCGAADQHADQRPARTASRRSLESSAPRTATPRRASSPRASATEHPDLCARLRRRAGARLRAARSHGAPSSPRPHRRAADDRARRDPALSRREGARAACSTMTT